MKKKRKKRKKRKKIASAETVVGIRPIAVGNIHYGFWEHSSWTWSEKWSIYRNLRPYSMFTHVY
jgi:ABC-type phosphonate transport system ATPase subunit